MSGRGAAAVSIATTLPVMAMLAAGASLQSQTGTSAGVTCAYFSGSAFGTQVLNVEIDGLSPPPIIRGMSCAAATTVLTDRGFGFVTMESGVEGDFNGNGIVDAADYVVWRDTSGTMRPKPSTTVITACAHFSGPAIRTELIGLERDGPQLPPFVTGMSCAAAFSALIDHGFVLLYKGPRVVLDLNSDGAVDSEDYDVWRSSFGRT